MGRVYRVHRQAGGDDRRQEAVGGRLGVVISDSGLWGELAAVTDGESRRPEGAGRGCGEGKREG